MPNYAYYQNDGGEEVWKPVPVSHVAQIRKENQPTFITVLSVSRLVDELSYEDKQKLRYDGPLYFDWDSSDIATVIEKVNAFLDKLAELKVDFGMVRLYATGGKGFHLEIPQEVFMPKPPKEGTQNLPTIYREMALELLVDTLDMRIYSQGRGRMWRESGKQRHNGTYKVPVTLQEVREMTPELYTALTSAPRILPPPKFPELCLELSILFAKCAEKVADKIKKRAKIKPDPRAREKAQSASIGLMMMGEGIKDTAGFNEVAMQLGIAANTAGLKLEDFLTQCEGLIESANLEWNRYKTPAKRKEQLAAMYHYTQDNPCYEFSIGAIKTLLFHAAPDLDGIDTTPEEIKEGIVEAKLESKELDEYADVAGGVALSKFGTYVDTEFGKKRVCAVSFADTVLLKSTDNGYIAGYETEVLVNGRSVGRQTLEMDLFSSIQIYNRFCSRLGHAFQGNEPQLRGLMMRFVEQAKRKGKVQYIAKREGLDVVNIPNHENEEARKPFMIWADARGVLLEPRMQGLGLELSFQGFPDPRGLFKTDLGESPVLGAWMKEEGSKEAIKATLKNLMTCQRPEMLGKMIGWHVSCFWRQLFQRTYGKFPLLHAVGAAGSGKTEMMIAMQSLFFLNQEPKPLTPGSTIFGLQQHCSASASIPLVIDEYKPWEMARENHNKIKLMFRDAYNSRDVVKGGGNRENDDYRSLHFTQLSSPVAFISEAVEDETAVLERVVLLTIVRPPASISMKWLNRFQEFRRNRQQLSMIGLYFASWIINRSSLEDFRTEFDTLYATACKRFLISDSDLKGGISDDEMRVKQNTKERSVFNHTVALFGFQQFRKLTNSLVGNELDATMQELEDGIYDRMADLNVSTTPEYLKVLSMMSTMSHHVEDTRPEAIRARHEYDFSDYGGKNSIEISVRACYMKYRVYCKSTGTAPLFSGHESFAYALKDSPALINQGLGKNLTTPGVATFDMDELGRLGVEMFKER